MFTATDLPSPTLNEPYAFAVTTTGGSGDVTFRVANGALPAGLALTDGGSIEGTPTAWGDFAVTIEATSGDETLSQAFDLRVVSRLWLAFDSDSKKYVVNVGAGEPHVPTEIGPVGTQEAWAPNGKYLSFVTMQGTTPTLNVVDLSGINVKETKAAWTGSAGCTPLTAWAPDSSRVATACGEETDLMQVDGSSTPHKISFPGHVTSLSWSPNAALLAATTVVAGTEVFAVASTTRPIVTPMTAGSSQALYWSPNSDAIVVYGRNSGQTRSQFFISKVLTAADVVSRVPIFNRAPVGDVVNFASFSKSGQSVFTMGRYFGSTTVLVSDVSVAPPVSQNGYPDPIPDAVASETPFSLANDDKFLIVVCDYNPTTLEYTVCDHPITRSGDTNYHLATSRRRALNVDANQLLLPISDAARRGSLVRFKYEEFGASAVDTLNTPTSQTRQPDFGFARDSKAVYFLETANSGAPPKTYHVDLRDTAHRTTLLETGGPSFLNSTAYSPSSTHLTTIVNAGTSGATLKLFDVRGATPSAAVTLSGTGRVTRASWQPTWN